jgi:hypothetical protein
MLFPTSLVYEAKALPLPLRPEKNAMQFSPEEQILCHFNPQSSKINAQQIQLFSEFLEEGRGCHKYF